MLRVGLFEAIVYALMLATFPAASFANEQSVLEEVIKHKSDGIIARQQAVSEGGPIEINHSNSINKPAKEQSTLVKLEEAVAASAASREGTANATTRSDMKLVVLEQDKQSYVLDLKRAEQATRQQQYEAAAHIYKSILEQQPDNIYTMLMLALLYHQQELYIQAKDLYIKILALEPDNSQALNNYLALLVAEKPDNLVNEIKKLEAVSPRSAFIPAQLGALYYQQKSWEKAGKYFAKAVRLQPTNYQYYYYFALVLERQGKKPEALAAYRKLKRAAYSGAQLPVSAAMLEQKIKQLS